MTAWLITGGSSFIHTSMYKVDWLVEWLFFPSPPLIYFVISYEHFVSALDWSIIGGGGRWLAAAWKPVGEGASRVHAAGSLLRTGRGDEGWIQMGRHSGTEGYKLTTNWWKRQKSDTKPRLLDTRWLRRDAKRLKSDKKWPESKANGYKRETRWLQSVPKLWKSHAKLQKKWQKWCKITNESWKTMKKWHKMIAKSYRPTRRWRKATRKWHKMTIKLCKTTT